MTKEKCMCVCACVEKVVKYQKSEREIRGKDWGTFVRKGEGRVVREEFLREWCVRGGVRESV